MTENMQADVALSRKAVFVRCCLNFLENRRSAVLRRIFCAGRSVSSAALLGVMQGRDTNPGAEETSKTVLRKFTGKSDKRSLQKTGSGHGVCFLNIIAKWM